MDMNDQANEQKNMAHEEVAPRPGNQLTEAEQEGENHHDELHQTEDFSGLDKLELLKRMEEANEQPDADHVRGTVQKLKEVFREHVKEELEAKRRAWETTKESDDDTFEPAPDPIADRFEDVLRKYNQKRSEQRRVRETEQRKNYQKKLELVEEL